MKTLRALKHMTKQKFSTREWRKVFEKYSNLGYPSEDEIPSDDENSKTQLALNLPGNDDSVFEPNDPIGLAADLPSSSNKPPNNTKIAKADLLKKPAPFMFSPQSSQR